MTISCENLLQVIPDLSNGPFLLHCSYGMAKPVSLTAGRLCARKVQQQSSQPTRWTSTSTGATIFSMASSIQFIKGVKEPTVPDVKLTRARDGSSGTASFVFKEPSVFEADNELGDITGMFLVDDEGTLSTVDVQAKFLNGKPDRIEAKYIMRSGFEWDRWASQRLSGAPPVLNMHAFIALARALMLEAVSSLTAYWLCERVLRCLLVYLQIHAIHGEVCRGE